MLKPFGQCKNDKYSLQSTIIFILQKLEISFWGIRVANGFQGQNTALNFPIGLGIPRDISNRILFSEYLKMFHFDNDVAQFLAGRRSPQ